MEAGSTKSSSSSSIKMILSQEPTVINDEANYLTESVNVESIAASSGPILAKTRNISNYVSKTVLKPKGLIKTPAVKAVSLLNSVDVGPTKSSSSAKMIVSQVPPAIINKTNYSTESINVESIAGSSDPIVEKTSISSYVSKTVLNPMGLVKTPAVKLVSFLNSMDAGPTKSSSSAEMIVSQVPPVIIDEANYLTETVNVFQSIAASSGPIHGKTKISNYVSKTLLSCKPIDAAGPSTPSQISEHESCFPGLSADQQSFLSNESVCCQMVSTDGGVALPLPRAKRLAKGVGVPLVPTKSGLPSLVQLTSKSKTSAKDPISNLRKRFSKIKENTQEEEDICALKTCCKPKSNSKVNWVQCDQCNNWFHYKCVGLKTISKGRSFSAPVVAAKHRLVPLF